MTVRDRLGCTLPKMFWSNASLDTPAFFKAARMAIAPFELFRQIFNPTAKSVPSNIIN
ncbi:hypothetical protein [Tolypothrix sp. VBCCA 56010]|uniref:hypothetical protein n=1 Tax=Tolypothrix sp. VBCCA 56010 TaxID=3137731 RepID=UPI003D7D0721